LIIFNKNTAEQSSNNVQVGKGVKFFAFVNAYGCEIDELSKIGSGAVVTKDLPANTSLVANPAKAIR